MGCRWVISVQQLENFLYIPPHHLWHYYPLLLCLITVGTEEDSLVYAFLASLIYSFYNYFLCPGIVTDAEHT